MADIFKLRPDLELSKIKLNGIEYNLKDAFARSQLEGNLKLLRIDLGDDSSLKDNTSITLTEQNIKNKDFQNCNGIIINYRMDDRVDIEKIYLKNTQSINSATYYFIGQNFDSFSCHQPAGGADNIATLVYHSADIPTLEPMANVESMLTSFGLNAAANLAPAQAGTAEVGKAVIQ